MRRFLDVALTVWHLSALALLGGCGGAKPLATEDADAARRDSLSIASGKDFFVKGIDAYNERNYAQALAQFKAAEPFIVANAKFNANDKALLYNAIGKTFFFLGNADSAAYYFAVAQLIEPQNFEAYNNSGYVKFVQRDYDLAIADFKKALAIKPDYAEATENLKLAEEFKSGKLTWDAEALFDKAEQATDIEEKIQLYARLAQLAPQFADAKNNLGVALFRAGRIDEARAVFEKLVVEHSDYAMGFNNLGYVFEALGRFDVAIANYRKAIELDSKLILAWENLSSALYEQGDYQGAMKAAQEVLLYEPSNADAKARIAACEKRLKGKRK